MRLPNVKKLGSRAIRWIRRRRDTQVEYPSRVPVMLSFLLPAMAIAAALFTAPVHSGNADLWRTQSIYQVLLERPTSRLTYLDCNRSVRRQRGGPPTLQCLSTELLRRKLAWNNRQAGLHPRHGFHCNMDFAGILCLSCLADLGRWCRMWLRV